MPVTYLGTATSNANSTATDTIDLTNHTVDSGTTLLLLGAGIRGASIAVSTITDWDTGQSFSKISETVPVGDTDINFEIWGVINPTVQTKTITITLDSAAGQYQWGWLANFGGTDTSSVAIATNVLENVDTTDPSTATSVAFSSAGTAGNAVVATAASVGDDSSPSTHDSGNGFTEVIDSLTGGGAGGNADSTFHMSYNLSGAPTACTVSFSGSADQCAGIYLELLVPQGITIEVPTGPWR
jgi:hypothetical protein